MPSSHEAGTVSVFWVLRVGVAMEFIGHGMLGLNHPAPWASYFAVVGIHHELAFRLMPFIGMLDIILGFLILVFPFRGLVGYMALWGLWTALLRPLAGETVWEAVERAGNYGAPLALFLLLPGGTFKSWFSDKFLGTLDRVRQIRFSRVLRWTTAFLLLGHGTLGFLVHKPLFAMQYTYIGCPGVIMEPWVGAFEMILGVILIWKANRSLLLFVLAWKLATEALSPIAGTPGWVFVEHGGSYAAPLALFLLQKQSEPSSSFGLQSA